VASSTLFEIKVGFETFEGEGVLFWGTRTSSCWKSSKISKVFFLETYGLISRISLKTATLVSGS